MWRWLTALLAHWLASTVATNGQPSACSTNSTVAPNVVIEPPAEWASDTKARLRQKYRLLGEDWAFPGLQPSCATCSSAPGIPDFAGLAAGELPAPPTAEHVVPSVVHFVVSDPGAYAPVRAPRNTVLPVPARSSVTASAQ